MSEHEIDFPSIDDIRDNEVVFEGDAPDRVNTSEVFAPNVLVGLFSETNPLNGPDWGKIVGGSLTAEAFISVFEKTSTDNNGIMRLKNLEGDAWASLTADGSLTGWSIRTILGDYYGFVQETIPSDGGAAQTVCITLQNLPKNPRILVGPTGVDDTYFLYECSTQSSITGSVAEAVGNIFVVSQGEASGAFTTYECINVGTSTTDPAEFTGPINGIEGSYFTSYTPLTGGAQCDYPYQFNSVGKVQQWSFDCSVSGWIGEGSTITQGIPPAQGNQGFQGNRGFQGFQGFQGFINYPGPTGVDGVVGNDYEIQYKDGNDLSANSLSTIKTDSSLDPDSGYSGNFQNYSESFKNDTDSYSGGGTINLNFDAYNVYKALNINITTASPGVDPIVTIQGFDTHNTGQSMTLILGYEGSIASSKIQIPANQNIYWAGGPLGNDDGGQTTNIDIDTTQKKYAVLYFISDGERVYGNRSLNYREEA